MDKHPLELFLQKSLQLKSEGPQLIKEVVQRMFKKEIDDDVATNMSQFQNVMAKRLMHRVLSSTKDSTI